MKFSNKTIFIISYEKWGDMLMSKHHYAIKLGEMGNKVFFIGHQDQKKLLARGGIQVKPTAYRNVSVLEHRLLHPYVLKFKAKEVYNFFIKFHINRMISKAGGYPDIVWSFDSGNSLPLKYFDKSRIRILMPVDGPFNHMEEKLSAEGADIIVSVTDEILRIYNNTSIPKLKVEHGLADDFLHSYELEQVADKQIRFGYSGSLLRNDLDCEVFRQIIQGYSGIKFEFWGEFEPGRSNIHLPQDVGAEAKRFIEFLRNAPNVILHGPVHAAALMAGLRRMDGFLICYSDKFSFTNSHKVLEYLATGKILLSTYLSNYRHAEDKLLRMLPKGAKNSDFYPMFKDTVEHIEQLNSPELTAYRKEYAEQYSYKKNIERIESFVSENFSKVE